jgi:hypothetical protein
MRRTKNETLFLDSRSDNRRRIHDRSASHQQFKVLDILFGVQVRFVTARPGGNPLPTGKEQPIGMLLVDQIVVIGDRLDADLFRIYPRLIPRRVRGERRGRSWNLTRSM